MTWQRSKRLTVIAKYTRRILAQNKTIYVRRQDALLNRRTIPHE
jgi:hypothetical protein